MTKPMEINMFNRMTYTLQLSQAIAKIGRP